MIKKLFRIILVAVLVAAIVLGVFFIKKYNTPVQPVMKMLPINSAFFIKTKDVQKLFKTLKDNTEYWDDLVEIESFNNLNMDYLKLDSTVLNQPKINEFIDGSTFILSAHNIGNSLNYLFLLNLKNVLEAENAEKYLNAYLGRIGNVVSKKYNRHKLYEFKNLNSTFYYAFVSGIFICSKNNILVEESIRQSDAEHSVLDQNGFIQVSETEGKFTDANIFLNLDKIPGVLSGKLSSRNSKIMESFASHANWIELDMNLKEDGILLNGFTSIDPYNFNYFNVFVNQEPVKFQAAKILPREVPAFVRFGVSDFTVFSKDYKKYEKQIGQSKRQDQLSDIKKQYDIDFEQLFSIFIENEFMLVYSTKLNSNNQNTPYCIINTKSKSLAENEITKFLKAHAKSNNKSFSKYYTQFSAEEDLKYKIYEFPESNICALVFGSFFQNVQANYFTFIDNYLIFAENKDILKSIIRESIIGNSLSYDVNFNTMTDNLSGKSNFLLYSNIPRSNKIILNNLNKSTGSDFESNKEVFNKFHSIGIQFLSNGEMIYNNIYLQYNPVKYKKATTFWESKIDDNFAFKPFFARNHYTNEKEIFLQDQTNAVYLVSNSGRILWKQRLNEEINSEIYQIDYYKNGKLQLLFSTKNYIHLIDRNGNYVDKYPVKLKSPATAGLALFDYSKNKEYRIFIPCSDKSIYLYDKRGKIISGWNFGKTESYVRHPVQHFVANSRDYIVFSDSLQVYILNRRGETRVKLSESIQISKNNTIYLEKAGNYRMVSTTARGEMVYIYFNGTVDKKKTIDLSPDHFFDYKDVDGDYEKDKIFIDQNELTVINSENEELFQYSFSENINEKPIYFLFPGYKGKIGIVSSKTNEIFLFNDNGSLYNGFPLRGNAPFSISRLNSKNNYLHLIVGDGNSFLLNYQLK